MNGIFGNKMPCQVGMIVADIETAKRKMAALLGVEVPPTVGVGDYAITKTVYMDQPAPDANCNMAFFETGGVQIELIQPNEARSTWRDFLEQHGEGMHHYGFMVDDIYKSIDAMKAAGYKLTQFGIYGDGSGAYAYFDCTEDVKCFIELLTNFKK